MTLRLSWGSRSIVKMERHYGKTGGICAGAMLAKLHAAEQKGGAYYSSSQREVDRMRTETSGMMFRRLSLCGRRMRR